MSSVDIAVSGTSVGFRDKLLAYMQLGKLQIVELWAGVPLTWSLLPNDRFATTTFVLLTLSVVAEAGITSAALALDDVAGVRDGVDVANHKDTDRYGVRKPLLDGRLTEREALRFATVGGAAAATAIATSLLFVDTVPWWSPVLTVSVVVLALNYSYWMKLSYIGGCEVVTFVATSMTLVLPYAMITGTISGTVVLESFLIGCWMLQIAVFSNTQDATGDRAANRMTFAASHSESGNRIFIDCVFAAGLVATALGFALGLFAWWYAVALVPGWILTSFQLRAGFKLRDWLVARSTGFWAFRLYVAGLFVANLIAMR